MSESSRKKRGENGHENVRQRVDALKDPLRIVSTFLPLEECLVWMRCCKTLHGLVQTMQCRFQGPTLMRLARFHHQCDRFLETYGHIALTLPAAFMTNVPVHMDHKTIFVCNVHRRSPPDSDQLPAAARQYRTRWRLTVSTMTFEQLFSSDEPWLHAGWSRQIQTLHITCASITAKKLRANLVILQEHFPNLTCLDFYLDIIMSGDQPSDLTGVQLTTLKTLTINYGSLTLECLHSLCPNLDNLCLQLQLPTVSVKLNPELKQQERSSLRQGRLSKVTFTERTVTNFKRSNELVHILDKIASLWQSVDEVNIAFKAYLSVDVDSSLVTCLRSLHVFSLKTNCAEFKPPWPVSANLQRLTLDTHPGIGICHLQPHPFIQSMQTTLRVLDISGLKCNDTQCIAMLTTLTELRVLRLGQAMEGKHLMSITKAMPHLEMLSMPFWEAWGLNLDSLQVRESLLTVFESLPKLQCLQFVSKLPTMQISNAQTKFVNLLRQRLPKVSILA